MACSRPIYQFGASVSKSQPIPPIWVTLCPNWRNVDEFDRKSDKMLAPLPIQGVQDGERTSSYVGQFWKVQLCLLVLVCLHRDSSGGRDPYLFLAITGTFCRFLDPIKHLLIILYEILTPGGRIWRNSWAFCWIQFYIALGHICRLIFFSETCKRGNDDKEKIMFVLLKKDCYWSWNISDNRTMLLSSTNFELLYPYQLSSPHTFSLFRSLLRQMRS